MFGSGGHEDDLQPMRHKDSALSSCAAGHFIGSKSSLVYDGDLPDPGGSFHLSSAKVQLFGDDG